MRTIEGGIIWPSVPAAAIEPAERLGAYPFFSNAGKAITVIVTTVAPTIPVDAASKAPTRVTDNCNPPGAPRNIRLMASNRSSAIRDFSRIRPMNTKKGIASNVGFVTMP